VCASSQPWLWFAVLCFCLRAGTLGVRLFTGLALICCAVLLPARRDAALARELSAVQETEGGLAVIDGALG
jgi:hypothetical protein